MPASHRQLYIFTGSVAWCHHNAQLFIQQQRKIQITWVGETRLQLENESFPADIQFQQYPHHKIKTLLGGETDCLIYDAIEIFHPNEFGISTGTLRGGGICILMLPISNHTEPRFYQRLQRVIKQHSFIDVFSEQQACPPLFPKIITSPLPHTDKLVPTSDQQRAIDAIHRVLKGHRKRPLVITADRGRGKSAALGMAANQFPQKKILITAPSKQTVNVVFQQTKANKENNSLRFISPDELTKTLPSADLLLVDEAAAIPTPLLEKWLKHYPRMVFSTTQHGYEGTGKGFDVRFRSILDSLTPDWHTLQLHQPIRWKKNDLLENFVFDALLLNAEPFHDKTAPQHSTPSSLTHINKIQRNQLIQNEPLLRNIFGLLVLAHYQTKPSDLAYLLDDPSVSVYIFSLDTHVIGIALTASEGNFSDNLAKQVCLGKRRIKGHLIPQNLALQSGLKTSVTLQGERIVRIAIHPNYQRRGYGKALVQGIQERLTTTSTKVDYVGVSYAAESKLIHFWSSLGFSPVRLGLKRDASSGTHSLIQISPLSKQGKVWCNQLSHTFHERFIHQLSDPFKYLETELADQLLQGLSSISADELTRHQQQQIKHYSQSNSHYEDHIAALWHWLYHKIHSSKWKLISQNDRYILIARIFQKYTWQQLVETFHLQGKKQAAHALKAIIKRHTAVDKF